MQTKLTQANAQRLTINQITDRRAVNIVALAASFSIATDAYHRNITAAASTLKAYGDGVQIFRSQAPDGTTLWATVGKPPRYVDAVDATPDPSATPRPFPIPHPTDCPCSLCIVERTREAALTQPGEQQPMNTENIADTRGACICDKRTALLDLDCTVCGAPLTATTIRIGTDGRPAQDGEPMPVNKCVICGENFPVTNPDLSDPAPAEGKPAFVIDSDNRANWYMRKRFLAEQEIALLEAQHADRMRSLRGDLDRLNAHFAPQLEAYTREKLAASKSKARSHKFTFGTASFRTIGSRWEVTDPVTALASARLVCPEAVITPDPKLDKAVLLAHVERTAEVVPGVGRSEERQSFSIKYNTEKSQAAQHVSAEQG